MRSILVYITFILSIVLSEAVLADQNIVYSSSGDIIGLEELYVVRTPHLDPEGHTIQVFVVETEPQDVGAVTGDHFNDQFHDHTCLHRAFNGAVYIMEAFYDGSQGAHLNKTLLEDMGKPFLGLLNFDAFVNPALYTSLCASIKQSKDEKYSHVVDKIVYFNTDNRYASVAGIYANSTISPALFVCAQNAIRCSIEKKEGSAAVALQHYKDAALCLNSDYQQLMFHLNKLQVEKNYRFAFVTTKFGGWCGHGITIIVNKVDSLIQFICFDGANGGFYNTKYKRCTDLLAHMINDNNVINTMIIRYLSAMKQYDNFYDEIKKLGLDSHPLYTSHYAPSYFYSAQRLAQSAFSKVSNYWRNA
jgi:hypothetical protein